MRIFSVIGILTTLAALFATINRKFLRLPMTVGLMLQSLFLAVVLIFISRLGIGLEAWAQRFLHSVRFDEVLLEGILSFLLFSGSLFVDLEQIRRVKLDIAALALVGVALSTLMVGFALYSLSLMLGMELRLIYCLLFGALIAPTDPIAVLATLKRVGAGPMTEARIAGEALFNDGVGIVLFLTLLRLAGGGGDFHWQQPLLLFLREAGGGLALGGLIGGLGYFLMRGVDSYPVEILITLAMVTGGYALAHHLEVSGPLAMVVAGLLIGSRGRARAMSGVTRGNLDLFWEVIEDILNAILFTLIGLEILAIFPELSFATLIAGLVSIPVVLLARFLSVGALSLCLSPFKALPRRAVPLLTWGGIRGGISIALALSIGPVPERNVVIVVTYMVAVFTLLVQATTVRFLVHGHHPEEAGPPG